MPTKINAQPSRTVVIVAVAKGKTIRKTPRAAVKRPMTMLHAERFLISLVKFCAGIRFSFYVACVFFDDETKNSELVDHIHSKEGSDSASELLLRLILSGSLVLQVDCAIETGA